MSAELKVVPHMLENDCIRHPDVLSEFIRYRDERRFGGRGSRANFWKPHFPRVAEIYQKKKTVAEALDMYICGKNNFSEGLGGNQRETVNIALPHTKGGSCRSRHISLLCKAEDKKSVQVFRRYRTAFAHSCKGARLSHRI